MLPDVQLGPTGLTFRPLGLGVWQWGDRYWAYDDDGLGNARQAFDATLDAGITLFDTAEILRRRRVGAHPGKADSGYGPAPVRRNQVQSSAESSHDCFGDEAARPEPERLDVDVIDLYQVHHPYTVLRMEGVMGRLADAVRAGKVKYVGVSNYNEKQMRKAHKELAKRGVAARFQPGALQPVAPRA